MFILKNTALGAKTVNKGFASCVLFFCILVIILVIPLFFFLVLKSISRGIIYDNRVELLSLHSFSFLNKTEYVYIFYIYGYVYGRLQ